MRIASALASADRPLTTPSRFTVGGFELLDWFRDTPYNARNEMARRPRNAQLYCSSAGSRAEAHRRGWLTHPRVWRCAKGPRGPFDFHELSGVGDEQRNDWRGDGPRGFGRSRCRARVRLSWRSGAADL